MRTFQYILCGLFLLIIIIILMSAITEGGGEGGGGAIGNEGKRRRNEVVVYDALALPLRDASFDAVIAVAILHHFSTVTHRLKVWREVGNC